MNNKWLWSGALLAGLIASPLQAASPVTIDPIEQPALPSALASTTQLTGVARAGERLVAVGWRGHIVFSDDNGKSWQQAAVPVSTDLTAVYFVTARQGWAVGHGGVILHSADGGNSWVKQQDGNSTGTLMAAYYEKNLQNVSEQDRPRAERLVEEVQLNYGTGPEQPWLDVFFEDEQHGYVVGPFNLIMETQDGGEHWTPLMDRVDNSEAQHLTSIVSVDGTLYIASERGTVFRRNKNDDSFARLTTGYTGTFFGVEGQGALLLAYGLRGNAYRSTDRGETWAQVDTHQQSTLTGGTVLNDGRLALISQGGTLLIGNADASAFTSVKLEGWPFANVRGTADGQLAIVGAHGVQLETVPHSAVDVAERH